MRPYRTHLLLIMMAAAAAVTSLWPGAARAAETLVYTAPKPGEAAAYDLEMTGYITITPPNSPAVNQSVTLRAALGVSWEEALPTGGRAAHVSLITPVLQLGKDEVEVLWDNTNLALTFNNRGQLLKAETPAPLSRLGIDMTLVLLGLALPYPAAQVNIGDRWDAKTTIGDASKGAYNLDGTYTLRNIESWSTGKLARVEAAAMAITPQNKLLMRRPQASLVAYVNPGGGRVERSSVSMKSVLNLPSLQTGSYDEPTAEIAVTTSLTYLGPLDAATLRQAAANAASASKPGSTSKPALPVSVVNQPLPVVVVPPPAADLAPAASALPQSGPTAGIALTMPYADPAGRFSLALPAEWRYGSLALSLDTTRFAGPRSSQRVDVTVIRSEAISLENAATLALAAVAGNAAEYNETVPLHSITIDGNPAFSAQYDYTLADGERRREVAFITRRQSYDYILQYGDNPQQKEVAAMAQAIAGAWRVGDTPAGYVPPAVLANAGYYEYTDPEGRFSLEAPYLWPLFAATVNTVTFADLGRQGYLSVYVEDSTNAFSGEDAVQRLLASERAASAPSQVTPRDMDGLSGACIGYTWQAAADSWDRQVCAATHQNLLFVLAVDYNSAGSAEHAGVIERLLASFRLGPAVPSAIFSSPPPPPSTPAPPAGDRQVAGQATATVTTGGRTTTPNNFRLEDPLDERRLIVMGRLGEHRNGQNTWLPGIILQLVASQSVYVTVTDNDGYFAFTNVAPLTRSAYVLASAEGRLFSGREPVKAAISGLSFATPAGRALDIGTVVLVAPEGNPAIVLRTPAAAPLADPASATRHFLGRQPTSGWAALLRAISPTP